MYKVFVNDTPLIITSSTTNPYNFSTYLFKNIVFEEVMHKLKEENSKGIILLSEDLENDWQSFLTSFDVVPAAGGLVINQKNEILFIYRNNVWDLPKGKIEKGETIKTAAVREVEEECGIFNLKLEQKLLTTYHTYYQNRLKLKETHWFLMTSNYTEILIPQLEEGITEAIFKDKEAIKKALQNSYENIKLVYHAYIKH